MVIVESPAKAKTIQKYLGPDFEVAASKGHVRDLPKSKFGIDIEGGWIPTYRNLADRKEELAVLKKLASKCDTIYLAPDPDREGEAIAWHLSESLGLNPKKTRRVTFNEITRKAVTEAFNHPSEINMDRVNAQEARRFLDRVVGYNLSPLLSRVLAKEMSAGRVQSVAVRLIVEREREIQKFQSQEYWKILASLSRMGSGGAKATVTVKKDGQEKDEDLEQDTETGEVQEKTADKTLAEGAFQAELAEWDGQKFSSASETATLEIATRLHSSEFKVSRLEQKDREERSQPPFTTSSLQQQASIRLRFTAKKTMGVAQALYQGVELAGEGQVALITYMRTDSTRVSEDALKSCRDHIQNAHGDKYLPEKPNRYTSGKSAQEAHEAIRPTDLAYTPEMVANHLPSDQARLYALIYNRFVASQMTPALFSVTQVEITAGQGLFKAQGKILKFPGYRKVLPPLGKQEDSFLPHLEEKQKLDLLNLLSSQHFTQPPPRYNEASLVKMLEKEGIGRPSTYAAILSKIQEREYVELKERRFFATETGMKVTDLLVEYFPKVMDLKFTSHMEEELDQIETREIPRNQVLDDFYGPFSGSMNEAKEKMPGAMEKCPQCGKEIIQRFSRRGRFFGCSGYPECNYIKRAEGEEAREKAIPTDHNCPICGKQMMQRTGRTGAFLGCSGYPECTTTMNFDAEGKPVVTSQVTEHKCEKCGKAMVMREGSRGPFLACSGYPKCKNAKDVDAQGNPMQPMDLGVACDKCGGPMAVRRGPRGPFLGCAAYPKCRNAKPIPEELKEKVDAMFPPRPKKEIPQIEVTDLCPECDGPMKIRPGKRGFFLGCNNYPKCKGTKQLDPEIAEKLQFPGPAK
ncbi:MAG: type I DNA topoisomerase [Gemmataceae bacterium]|nr:type I DNA topoisomerase [Gemmataceae bacterium]